LTSNCLDLHYYRAILATILQVFRLPFSANLLLTPDMHFFNLVIVFGNLFLSVIAAAHLTLSKILFLFCSYPPHFLISTFQVDCFFISGTEREFLLQNLLLAYTCFRVCFFHIGDFRLMIRVADFVIRVA